MTFRQFVSKSVRDDPLAASAETLPRGASEEPR
jgi:hypothetical protein